MTAVPGGTQGWIDQLVRLSQVAADEFRDAGAITPQLHDSLTDCTWGLLREKESRGELGDPYELIRARAAPAAQGVETYLDGRRVLVTGAAGGIGAGLSARLIQYNPSHLYLVDRDRDGLARLLDELTGQVSWQVFEACPADIARPEEIGAVFQWARPAVVFHLAAEREPSRAEAAIREALLSNIRGTETVARCAAEAGVDRFIHASTGKCRFLFEDRVYPATKKVAEVLVEAVADQAPDTRFGLVRFHHVVDNSIVQRRFLEQIGRREPLTVHLPPDRRKHGQSRDEAIAMLLNAGLVCDRGEVFGSTRQLDYFSVLDLALYLLAKSGERLPLRFTTPSKSEGYELEEFGGTRLAPGGLCLTHSFHTLETAGHEVLEELGLVRTAFPNFDRARAVALAHDVLDFAAADEPSAEAMKQRLFANLYRFAEDVHRRAPVSLLVDSLTRGLGDGPEAHREAVSRHADVILLLLKGLADRPANSLPPEGRAAMGACLDSLASALRGVPEAQEVARWVAAIRSG